MILDALNDIGISPADLVAAQEFRPRSNSSVPYEPSLERSSGQRCA